MILSICSIQGFLIIPKVLFLKALAFGIGTRTFLTFRTQTQSSSSIPVQTTQTQTAPLLQFMKTISFPANNQRTYISQSQNNDETKSQNDDNFSVASSASVSASASSAVKKRSVNIPILTKMIHYPHLNTQTSDEKKFNSKNI